MNHFHWHFQATNTGQADAVDVHVIGHYAEASAREAVAGLVQRESYRLVKVFECSTCAYQADMSDILRRLNGTVSGQIVS